VPFDDILLCLTLIWIIFIPVPEILLIFFEQLLDLSNVTGAIAENPVNMTLRKIIDIFIYNKRFS